MPTDLPVRTLSTPAFAFGLIALASLLPLCLSLLLAYRNPAVAHAFLLMGRLG